MKLLHTADWQLGCAFRSFGDRAAELRKVRVRTLRRALEKARAVGVDAFLIAGDLFDDNQVASEWVRQVVALFEEFPDVPTFILPGNHDPVSGPGCVWRRAPIDAPPPHVHVFYEPAVQPLGPACLLANPLTQKQSSRDPSLVLRELAAGVSAEKIRIGLTHGALAIEGRHQPNDHPIHPQAASRAGLDYLAVGHWHRWQEHDGGRLVMPGTPEPDGFDHADGRYGALVELTEPGVPPRVERVELAALRWETVCLEVGERAGEDRAEAVRRQLAHLWDVADRTVLRVRLSGSVEPAGKSRWVEALEAAMAPFVAWEIVDETHAAWSAVDWRWLGERSPVLAGVVADLARLRGVATGEPAPGGEGVEPLSVGDLNALLAREKLELAELDEGFFETALEVLSQQLDQEGEA